MHVGARIKAQRLLLHISQEHLANDLGLTFQQVQKYECGSNRVSASRLYEIAKLLSVPAAFFFEGLPPVAEGAPTDPMRETAAIELVSTFNRLTAGQRSAVRELLHSFRDR